MGKSAFESSRPVFKYRVNVSIHSDEPNIFKKLETRGFIRRFTALLDARLLGMTLVAHVDVMLEHPRFERPFLDEIENLVDVQECYALSGDFTYRLKLRARDVEHLEALLREKVQTLRGVVRTRVELSLSVKKDSTLLSLA